MSLIDAAETSRPEANASRSDAVASRSDRRHRSALARVTGRLTALNLGVGLVGIITGPLQARALGPAGRGELAAILTPFAFLPTLVSVGLGSYAIRAVARGKRPGEAFGSLLPVTLGIGFAVAAASPVIAGLLAGGRAAVYTMLIVGLVIFPVSMIANMLMDIAVGLEDWRPVMRMRVIPPAVQLFGISVLFAVHALTVQSVAVVAFGGGLLSVVPLVGVYKRCWPMEFSSSELRAGVVYGAKCWLGGLSSLANARLDQLLMIRLVSSSVLGLYAVAVTLATFFISPVVASISTAANARMARGDDAMTRRLCRLTLFGAAVVALGVAIVCPFALRYAFGAPFVKAVPMALILLVASVPNAAGGVLNTSVSASGHPGLSARGEGIALVVTVAGLAIALPTLGGTGAAIVSVVAYSTQFCYLLLAAKRVHGGVYREYLVVTRADMHVMQSIVATRVQRLRGRLAAAAS